LPPCAVAVRWIAHEDTALGGLLDGRQLLDRKRHVLFDARGGEILPNVRQGLLGRVASDYSRRTFGLASRQRRVPLRRERRCVVSQPALEPKALPQETGRTVGRHQRTFDQECAGTAGRVHQRQTLARRLRPTRQVENRRSQILLERRLSAGLPITSPVQPFAGEIESELVMRLTDV